MTSGPSIVSGSSLYPAENIANSTQKKRKLDSQPVVAPSAEHALPEVIRISNIPPNLPLNKKLHLYKKILNNEIQLCGKSFERQSKELVRLYFPALAEVNPPPSLEGFKGDFVPASKFAKNFFEKCPADHPECPLDLEEQLCYAAALGLVSFAAELLKKGACSPSVNVCEKWTVIALKAASDRKYRSEPFMDFPIEGRGIKNFYDMFHYVRPGTEQRESKNKTPSRNNAWFYCDGGEGELKNSWYINHYTPLNLAAAEGHSGMVRFLLDPDHLPWLNPNYVGPKQAFADWQIHSSYAFFLAALRGQESTARALIAQGIKGNLNFQFNTHAEPWVSFCTPLHAAVLSGNKNIVELCLSDNDLKKQIKTVCAIAVELLPKKAVPRIANTKVRFMNMNPLVLSETINGDEHIFCSLDKTAEEQELPWKDWFEISYYTEPAAKGSDCQAIFPGHGPAYELDSRDDEESQFTSSWCSLV